MNLLSIPDAANSLLAGQILAYPTEGVYGLGCRPDEFTAIAQLIALKGRDAGKGFILIAGSWAQLLPYVDVAALNLTAQALLAASWPGPVTWILPARAECPQALKGAHRGIAVRLTAHPVVQALCAAAESALISTSANVSGHPPLRDLSELLVQNWPIAGVVAGPLGTQLKPTPIFDLVSYQKVR